MWLIGGWGGGISVVLHRGPNCPLSRAMDGRVMRRGIISSCQSAATSEIVKRCCSSLCKQHIASTQTLTLTSTLTRTGKCSTKKKQNNGKQRINGEVEMQDRKMRSHKSLVKSYHKMNPYVLQQPLCLITPVNDTTAKKN